MTEPKTSKQIAADLFAEAVRTRLIEYHKWTPQKLSKITQWFGVACLRAFEQNWQANQAALVIYTAVQKGEADASKIQTAFDAYCGQVMSGIFEGEDALAYELYPSYRQYIEQEQLGAFGVSVSAKECAASIKREIRAQLAARTKH